MITIWTLAILFVLFVAVPHILAERRLRRKLRDEGEDLQRMYGDDAPDWPSFDDGEDE